MFGNHCDLWQIIERGPTNSLTLKSRWGEKPLQTHIIYIYMYMMANHLRGNTVVSRFRLQNRGDMYYIYTNLTRKIQ